MRIAVDVRKGDASARDDLIADLEEMGWEMCDFSGSMLEINTFEFKTDNPNPDLEDLDYTIALGFPGVTFKEIQDETKEY